MGRGFAPIKAQPKKTAAKSAKLTSISQIQTDLSSYFNEIKDQPFQGGLTSNELIVNN